MASAQANMLPTWSRDRVPANVRRPYELWTFLSAPALPITNSSRAMAGGQGALQQIPEWVSSVSS